MYMYHLLKLNWVYTHTPAAQRQMTAIWRNWAVLLLAAIYLHEPSCATAGWRTPLSRPLAGHLILTPGLDHRWWYGRLDMWYIRCKWNKVVSMEYVIIGVSTKANGRIRHSVKDHQTSIVFHCISFRFFEPLFVVYLMSYLIKILVAENIWENKWCELPTFNHVLCQFRNLRSQYSGFFKTAFDLPLFRTQNHVVFDLRSSHKSKEKNMDTSMFIFC